MTHGTDFRLNDDWKETQAQVQVVPRAGGLGEHRLPAGRHAAGHAEAQPGSTQAPAAGGQRQARGRPEADAGRLLGMGRAASQGVHLGIRLPRRSAHLRHPVPAVPEAARSPGGDASGDGRRRRPARPPGEDHPLVLVRHPRRALRQARSRPGSSATSSRSRPGRRATSDADAQHGQRCDLRGIAAALAAHAPGRRLQGDLCAAARQRRAGLDGGQGARHGAVREPRRRHPPHLPAEVVQRRTASTTSTARASSTRPRSLPSPTAPSAEPHRPATWPSSRRRPRSPPTTSTACWRPPGAGGSCCAPTTSTATSRLDGSACASSWSRRWARPCRATSTRARR